MKTFSTCRDIIVALGGPSEVARGLNLNTSTVQNWCDRNRIAEWNRDGLVALAKTKRVSGVTLGLLTDLSKRERGHVKKKEAREAAA